MKKSIQSLQSIPAADASVISGGAVAALNRPAPTFGEQATGCYEHPAGLGKYFGPDGAAMTPSEAYDLLRAGKSVEVPNAGASSYHQFFGSLADGVEVDVWEHTSSAGDWTFVFKDGEGGMWYVAFQSNRFPLHGFMYSIDFSNGFDTKEEIFEFLNNY